MVLFTYKNLTAVSLSQYHLYKYKNMFLIFLQIILQIILITDLVFGKFYTDHMLSIDWNSTDGWNAPKIEPFQNFSMHPGAKVLHYAQELFEGMKAYRGVDGKIRMFRPMHNMGRMNLSASRSCLPNFEGLEVLNCIRELVRIDSEWVPHDSSSSLYLRKTNY